MQALPIASRCKMQTMQAAGAAFPHASRCRFASCVLWLIVSILYWDGSVETLNVVTKLKTVLLLGVYSVYSALKIDLKCTFEV